MKKYTVLPVFLILLLCFAAVTAIGFVLKAEFVWGMGLGLLLFDAVLYPAFSVRKKRISRITTGEPIAEFTYSFHEADILAAALPKKNMKKRRGYALLICICLAICGGIFIYVVHQGNPAIPLWQLFALLVPAVLPYIVLWIYTAYEKGLILQYPCRSLIGRDFLVLANTRPVINERANLTAIMAKIQQIDGAPYLTVTYKSTAKARYGGTIRFCDTFDIRIPEVQEDTARQAVAVINAYK